MPPYYSYHQDDYDEVHVWTDGACSNNGMGDSRGGYGVYFGVNDSRNCCGPLPDDGRAHTNQRAELLAIKCALEIVENDDRPVVIHTDSKYSMQCMTEWLPVWEENGFVKSNGEPVKNLDLILPIDQLILDRGDDYVRFEYVPG